jgi:cytoskeletal protein CcmA (bactofilin family)
MIWKREDREEARREEARQDEGRRYEAKHAESRHAEAEGDEVEVTHEDVQVRETRKGVRRMAEQSGEVTIIGAGAKLEGTVVSAGSLRVDGQVKGQINADGDVMLAPQSQVEADIKAQNVSVAGRFKGNIVVKGRAELNRGGRVEGTVTSKTLVVEEGGILQGQSIMDQQAAAQPQAAPAQAPRAQAQPAQEAKV